MPFWIDEIAEQIDRAYPDKEEILIRDEKTASGRVHVGSLRGVAIHGAIAQALKERGRKATFLFEINDVDPMDGLPVYLDEASYRPFMGKPLRDVPAPDGQGKPQSELTATHNFARFYGNEFVEVIHKLGFDAKIVWASDFYDNGTYNEWIEKVCAHPNEIRDIYQKISGSEKGEEWFPLQMVCEKCGKVGTTTVTEFDGREATYHCEPNKVKWAVGCGHRGKASPFNGVGKLPWKVEWAVKWAGLHVDVEGSGKDHNAAGGSHDVSEAICRDVLQVKLPFNIPYEFFLFGGAKMSASKGLGASAVEAANMMPVELLRFLMLRTRPNQPIDFSIEGDTIPRLYDNHDECAAIHFGKESDTPDLGRAFYFAQLDPKKIEPHYFPRFSKIAFLIQIPYINISEEVGKMKGSPLTSADKEETEHRTNYAKKWLDDFADDRIKFEVQDKLPKRAEDLTGEQKEFLKTVVAMLNENPTLTGEELHAKLHDIRKQSSLEPREAFGAIYLALLGKDSGPQAGWFLESLDRAFIIQRFEEAIALTIKSKPKIQDLVTPFIVLHREVRERFPGIKLGFNTLKNVHVHTSHPELELLKRDLLNGLDFEDLKKNSPRLEAFREIYRGFGVKPSDKKPSPVALITRLANGKTIPSINVVVDIYNTLAIKHQLAIGVFDLDKITLPVHLKFAKGGELFQGIGMDKEVPLLPGELCYFDDRGLVMARDFNHLDCDKAKVTEHTKNLLLNVDGNAACTQEDVETCLVELETLLRKYCGGEVGERIVV